VWRWGGELMSKGGVGELGIPGLRHFLYKSRAYVQVTSPAYEGDYVEEENKFRLITLYQRIHDSLHIRPATLGSSRPAAKLVYLRTEHEAVLGWTSSTFELYVALSPLLPKTAVVSAARAVSKWVKGQESKLFLTSAPSF
ncbi:vacuolar fusion protein MON1, partial [Phenoliferia sp. Uapishka_3]